MPSLDAHYSRHPEARPSLAQRALAAAGPDDDPLAEEPELLARAADAVMRLWPGATVDAVLLGSGGGRDHPLDTPAANGAAEFARLVPGALVVDAAVAQAAEVVELAPATVVTSDTDDFRCLAAHLASGGHRSLVKADHARAGRQPNSNTLDEMYK